MVEKKTVGLEVQLGTEGVRRGTDVGQIAPTGTIQQQRRKEYIIIITDGKAELQDAASHLQEELKKQLKNGLDYIVEAVPDVSSAIELWKRHLLKVPLVIGDQGTAESSGSRFQYVRMRVDPHVLTGVVDAYNVRTPEGDDYRAVGLNPQLFVQMIALELKEMQRFRRILSRWDRKKLENTIEVRRKRIEEILHGQGDYVLQGRTDEQVRKAFGVLNTLDNWITMTMRAIQVDDVDSAANIWQMFERTTNWYNVYGVTVFGLDQSIGGGYHVGELRNLIEASSSPLGFKRVGNYEEACNLKRATEFYLRLNEEASEAAANAKGRIKQIWQMAGLNIPRVVGVLPARNGGVIFMEYKGLTIYPIGILGQDYPSILEGLIDAAKGENGSASLASQLLNKTFVAAAQKFGFWRANPWALPPLNSSLEDVVSYYAGKEVKLFEQAPSIFGISLDRSQLEKMTSFFGFINSCLQLRPEDMALRMDLRVEHLGYEVPGKPIPTAQEVIEAVGGDGSINDQKVGECLVIYDVGGKKMLVPPHHDFSHLREHPLVRWGPEQTELYMAIALASQHMFAALRGEDAGKEALKWYDILNGIKAGELEDFRRVSGFSGFGLNELLIDTYRGLEEARQILTMRLPRLYVRQEKLSTDPRQAEFIAKAIATRKEQYVYYIRRALEHLTRELQDYVRLPQTQQANLASVKESLEQLTGIEQMQIGRVLKCWDGF